MNEEKFWVLFSKKLSGEASREELHFLEEMIIEHPEWQYAIQNLQDIWQHQPEQDKSLEEDAYMLHLHRMSENNFAFDNSIINSASIPGNKNRFLKKWYWAAAVVLVGLFILPVLLKVNKKEKAIAREVNEISTRPGSKSRVELPDGSVVWLNAGSKLTYNKDFGKNTRAVTLAGEGFFDVAKNKDLPFVITTANISIKVLGTVFNVKAYPEDKQTETSLIHGSIEVTISNRPNDKIILSPSEKLIVENTFSKFNEKEKEKLPEITGKPTHDIVNLMALKKLEYNANDSTIAETEWVNNKLIFRSEPFIDLAVRMERWYNVSIEIKDSKLEQEKLNGTLENETITQALEALKISTPFEYEKKGNKIIIHR